MIALSPPSPVRAAASIPWLTATVAICAAAIFAIPGAAAALEYDRTALARGELWRAATGHLAHFDASHLAWDTATLLGLGLATETHSRTRTAVALALAVAAISAALWFLQPAFHSYRGLSGLACALGGLVAGNLFRHARRSARICGLLLVLFVGGKCAHEALAGTTLFAEPGHYEPVPLAHLVGFAVGTAAALAPSATFRRQTPG
jgi:rhomboid family GlyGly-CTERM serine protease